MRTHACVELLLLCAFLAFPSRAFAESSERDRDRFGPLVPDFAKLQSGGFAGTLTFCLGYAALEDTLNAGVLYGYVPPGGGRSVQSLHFVLSLRPGEARWRDARWLPLYAGFGSLWTWGPGYFVVAPPRYPRGYYHHPTAFRLTAHVGSELDWLPRQGLFERHGLYAELTTIDVFLYAYVKNPRVVNLSDIVSSSLGYRAAF